VGLREPKPGRAEGFSRGGLTKGLPTGGVYFSQGEKAQSMFLIKAGLLKLSKFTEDGNEIILDIRKGGDFLGENIFHENMNPKNA
jgi:CRP-like cAMP-binding protein